jgi:hypothetical protein
MNNQDKNILIKRFQTTMIGALFEFEKNFGYLWGQNKAEQTLTQKELDFLDLWDYTRNQILNNGNNQMRKAISDLEKTSGKYKFNYKFPFKNNEDIK